MAVLRPHLGHSAASPIMLIAAVRSIWCRWQLHALMSDVRALSLSAGNKIGSTLMLRAAPNVRNE